jgi:hypothetical protein
MLPRTFLAIQELGFTVDNQYTQMNATLDQILVKIAGGDMTGTAASAQDNQNSQSQIDAVEAGSYTSESSSPDTSTLTPGTQLCVTTSLADTRRDVYCPCQCHIRIQGRTPRWMSAIIGSLFYSYQLRPCVQVRSCSLPRCCQKTPSSSYFTYYFPTWAVRKALVLSSWNDLNGRNASWDIKIPR